MQPRLHYSASSINRAVENVTCPTLTAVVLISDEDKLCYHMADDGKLMTKQKKLLKGFFRYVEHPRTLFKLINVQFIVFEIEIESLDLHNNESGLS